MQRSRDLADRVCPRSTGPRIGISTRRTVLSTATKNVPRAIPLVDTGFPRSFLWGTPQHQENPLAWRVFLGIDAIERDDITGHIDAAESSEAIERKQPMENSEPNEPTEPIDNAEHTDPIESTEPFDAMERTESSEASDHLQRSP